MVADARSTRALRHLLKMGCDKGVKRVLVLEAQSRLGGRTFTQPLSIKPPAGSPLPSAAIDLGAAWIHGAANANRGPNPMVALSQAAQVPTCNVTKGGDSFNPEGQPDTDTWYRTYDDMAERFQTFYDDYKSSDVPSLPPSDAHSLGTVVTKFLALNPGFTTLQKKALAQNLQDEIVLEYAGDLNNLSARWLEEDYVWGGPDALPGRGYGALVSYLARGLDVRLGYVVQTVDYSSTAVVTVSGRAGGGRGAAFSLSAKYVVVTMPVGYLQAQLNVATPTLFKPALSTAQATAIKSLGMGLLNKIILAWNTTWWSDTFTTPWITIRNETVPGAFSDFYNLMATPVQLPVIIGFNAGSFAATTESLTDADTVARALAALSRTLPASKKIPPPAQTIVTRWLSDPWTRGSYSYNKAGMKEDARSTAFKPLGTQQRVGFAGEAVHPMYFSTVHGAYLSGQAEADRLVKALLGL